jgi:HEAT repeat protein
VNRPGPLTLTEDERLRVQGVADLASRGEQALDALVPLLDDRSWAVRRGVVAALAGMGGPAIARLCAVLTGRRDHENRLAAAVEALVGSRGDVEKHVLGLTDSRIPAVVCDAAQILGRRLSSAAVPKLSILATHADDNVALAAIEALGRIGDDAAVTALIAAVESRTFSRTFAGIEMLGRSRSPRGLRPLTAMLGDPFYAAEAARALGRIADPSALPSLEALLGGADDAIAIAAAVAVAEILDARDKRFGGSNPLDPTIRDGAERATIERLVRCLSHCEAESRPALIRVMGWIGGPLAVGALVDMLSADHAVSSEAASALSRLGRSAEPQLLAALRDGSSERRLLVLPLLGHRAEIAGAVVGCLSDPEPGVRALACDALARTGDTSSVPRLFALLGDADPQVGQSAVAAIQSLGCSDTEPLAREAAVSADVRVRCAALRILGYLGYPSSVGVLLAAIADPDERAREAAMGGLAYADDPRAVAALISATMLPSARARSTAIRALGRARSTPEALVALRAGLHDGDEWVRYFACQALARLHDTEAADAIAGLLDDAAGQVRVAVVEALATLQGVRAMDALHQAAAVGDPDVKRAALVGLGHVKDVSSLRVLRQALLGADPATRLVAVSALAAYELTLVGKDLDQALSDPDPGVRTATIALLAALPGLEATRLMIARLTDERIQGALVDALTRPVDGRVDGLAQALSSATAETAPLIVSALARMRSGEATLALEEAFASKDVTVRRAVAPALATMRTSSSRALLSRAASEDPDPRVRELGAAAIGR